MLSIEERVEALSDLLHLALDMPSIHSALDRRFEDVERAKRNIRDRAKEERKVRQLEMANKAKRDAAEAEARVAALRNAVMTGAQLPEYVLGSISLSRICLHPSKSKYPLLQRPSLEQGRWGA